MSTNPFHHVPLSRRSCTRKPTISALQASYQSDRKAPITLAPCTFLDRPLADWEQPKGQTNAK